MRPDGLAAALRRTGHWLSERLPSQCEICRDWGGRLCAPCLARFAPLHARCGRCGLRLGAALPACGDCLRDPPPFDRTICALDYAFPWDGLITAFKFHGQVDLAGVLAQRLLAALGDGAAASPRIRSEDAPALVLPVPLSDRRLAERGYNQAWELARRVAAARGLPACADGLQRVLHTAPQAGLTRAERQRNLRAALVAHPQRRASWQGRRVALVDDVMTTGATLSEAAHVLLSSGAAAVDVWVLARTPAPGSD